MDPSQGTSESLPLKLINSPWIDPSEQPTFACLVWLFSGLNRKSFILLNGKTPRQIMSFSFDYLISTSTCQDVSGAMKSLTKALTTEFSFVE